MRQMSFICLKFKNFLAKGEAGNFFNTRRSGRACLSCSLGWIRTLLSFVPGRVLDKVTLLLSVTLRLRRVENFPIYRRLSAAAID
jgi:hypothetical protein